MWNTKLLVLPAVLVLIAGIWLGNRIASNAQNEKAKAAVERSWSTLVAEQDSNAYQAATLHFEARIQKDALAALGDFAADSLVLIALRGQDGLSCEDLGRQLRELVRAIRNHTSSWELRVVVEEAEREVVESFLRRERIVTDGITTLSLSDLFVTRIVDTPAVVIGSANGNTVRGVSHPVRFKNVRPRSFASELEVMSY